jgi:SAM-dependent methyltransferase
MSALPSMGSFFPLYYQRPVWATGATLTAGFVALEAALHDRQAEIGSNPLWDALYASGYSIYLVPLALSATRTERGSLRRLLLAFTALLLAGYGSLFLPWERFGLGSAPCLQVSGIVLVILFCARRRQTAAVAAGLVLGAATVLTIIATQRHAGADIVVGMVLGSGAAGFADWRDLSILRRDHPWQAARHELTELRSLVWGNRVAAWDSAYTSGHWDFLDSPDQRPRHYLIAGLLADRLQHAGARVLDAGCGLATLYWILRGRVGEYVGLDFSVEALKRAEAAYGIDPDVRFVCAPFEQCSEGGFDAVVLNEVLYYYPLHQVENIFAFALSRLRPGATLVISMNRNFKARLIWRRLERVASAEQGIRVYNLVTGSYWTVKVYRAPPSAASAKHDEAITIG